MGVKIITDSTSYIPQNLIESMDIEIVSLNVSLEDKHFKEVDISSEYFYGELEKLKTFPKSSQPEIGEMLSLFRDNLSEGDSVLGIFLSSEMSGTYQSALLAKSMILEEFSNGNIEILDSKSNCMQLGWMVLEAAKEAKKGSDLNKCVEKALLMRERTRFVFAPKNLDYLKMGGRIGGASAFLGSLLKIIPILTVKDGKTDVITKVRSSKKAIAKIVEIMKMDVEKFGLGEVVVHHIQNEEMAKLVIKELKSIGIDAIIGEIGAVIGTHVGPGAIGLAYYTKRPMNS
jgi:DegV family protein with EDD domain